MFVAEVSGPTWHPAHLLPTSGATFVSKSSRGVALPEPGFEPDPGPVGMSIPPTQAPSILARGAKRVWLRMVFLLEFGGGNGIWWGGVITPRLPFYFGGRRVVGATARRRGSPPPAPPVPVVEQPP